MKKNFFLTISLLISTIQLNAQSPNWAWAKSEGGTKVDSPNGIAKDGWGNIYVVGGFTSPSILFGSTVLTNTDTSTVDMFIVKYDANGTVIWAQSAGYNSNDYAVDVVTDALGNIYVTGVFYSSTITFGTATLYNTSVSDTSDIFIVKYDSIGNVIWAKSAIGNENDASQSIASDSIGNICLTGNFFSSSVLFGTTTLNNSGTSSQEVFIAKYDPNGNVLWAQSAGTIYNDGGSSVTIDKSGNVYLTGGFYHSSITFGTFILNNAGQFDIFIVKYDSSGNVIWAYSQGGNDTEGVSDLILDNNGNIIMTGMFWSPSITFGTTTLNNAGAYGDAYIVKYDTAWNFIWARSGGGNDYDFANRAATDSFGNIYICGSFQSDSIIFGSTTLINSGSWDMFLFKYNANGSPLWAYSAGGSTDDSGLGLISDVNGNVYITGYFGSSFINFGTITLNTAGDYDIFIAKLDAVTGIETVENSNNNVIYPNPVSDYLTVNLENTNEKVEVSINNLLGEKLSETKNNQLKTTIDVSALPSGIYFVKLQNKKGTTVRKFIKK